MRHSDCPISKPAQDLFERSGFALTLAQAIDRLPSGNARDGFVIAILGEWGSGKTSIIQLIRRYLQHIEMARSSEKPLRWETSAVPQAIGQLEVLAQSFEQVERRIADLETLNKDVSRWDRDGRWQELRRWVSSDRAANAADRYWQLKSAVEADPRTIIVTFSPWMIAGRAELTSALFTELARALGKRLGDDFKQAIGALLKRLSEFAPVAGTGLDLATHGLGGGILRAGGTWTGHLAKKMTSGPTLDSLRENLQKVLARLDEQRVLLIIDDLDRLTFNEALELVSVIKSLGDLPNLIYLFSYDE
jgi:predicted KAP-like P-loop ATPase